MSSSQDANGPPKAFNLPNELWSIMSTALKVGAAGGVAGFTIGGVAGILSGGRRGLSPRLLAISSGLQAFALSTTFWATRTAMIQHSSLEAKDSNNTIKASTISGGGAGILSAFIRGKPKSAILTIPLLAICGGTGQYIYNSADARQLARRTNPVQSTSSWMDSKWSPVKVLTDDEYEKMLQEKLLKINVEIALVDDNIQRVKEEAIISQQKVSKEEKED